MNTPTYNDVNKVYDLVLSARVAERAAYIEMTAAKTILDGKRDELIVGGALDPQPSLGKKADNAETRKALLNTLLHVDMDKLNERTRIHDLAIMELAQRETELERLSTLLKVWELMEREMENSVLGLRYVPSQEFEVEVDNVSKAFSGGHVH